MDQTVRPIDANAFAKDLEMEAASVGVSWVCDRHEAAAIKSAFKQAAELARSFPTLDYAPVKHGEFERQPEEYIVGLQVTPIYCKTCDTTYFTMNKDGRRTICCPYCGAKMDGKEDT